LFFQKIYCLFAKYNRFLFLFIESKASSQYPTSRATFCPKQSKQGAEANFKTTKKKKMSQAPVAETAKVTETVKVIVRCRPMNNSEGEKGCSKCVNTQYCHIAHVNSLLVVFGA